MKRLEKFLLDLDRGFAVLARDKKYQKNDVIFQCDRVFYNFRLNCCILSSFKKDNFENEYKKYFPIKDELEKELKREIFVLNIK